jgi:hypothetical protein
LNDIAVGSSGSAVGSIQKVAGSASPAAEALAPALGSVLGSALGSALALAGTLGSTLGARLGDAAWEGGADGLELALVPQAASTRTQARMSRVRTVVIADRLLAGEPTVPASRAAPSSPVDM